MGLDGLVVIACQGDIMELGLRAGLGGDAGVAGVGLEEAEEVVGRLGSWEGSGVVSWGGTRREAVRRGSRGGRQRAVRPGPGRSAAAGPACSSRGRPCSSRRLQGRAGAGPQAGSSLPGEYTEGYYPT